MPSHTDFNGDGRDDIYWRELHTGWSLQWLGQPDGSFVDNTLDDVFNQWPNNKSAFDYRVVASGDFNGDGRDDLLFSRKIIADTRLLDQWFSQEDGTFIEQSSAPLVDSYWDVEAAGDFNGDGRTDILLRRSDIYFQQDEGWFVKWLAKPDGSFSGNIAPAIWIHPAWHIQATGDFNKDGRDDMLLRHEDGWLVEWLTQPDGSFSNNSAATSWIHPDWHVLGTGDFNKDGHDDLLLRHDDGWLVEWLGQANGSFSPNNAASKWLHPAWNVFGTGDYNGDGYHDVLLRHEDGTVTNLLGQENGTFFENGSVATYAYLDLAYKIEPYPFSSINGYDWAS